MRDPCSHVHAASLRLGEIIGTKCGAASLPIPTAFLDYDAMKITITHARANLRALWDKIERTRWPATIQRRGHADMVLLPAADFDRLHDHLRALILAIRRRNGDPHPAPRREALPALLKRIAALSSGVPIDHDKTLDEVTAVSDAQGERMQDPETPTLNRSKAN